MIRPRPHRGPPPAPSRAGFTLIESIVVLLLLGLAAAAVGPHLQALLRPGSLAAAQELADVYREARAMAADRGRRVIVTLDPTAGTWHIYVGVTGSPAEAAARGNLLTDRPDTRLVTAGGGPAVIRFGPGGRARGPAVAAERDGRTLGVTVDPWTGVVRVR